MALLGLDLCLLVSTIVVILLDIVLALCIRFVLPYHVTQRGWYPANEKTYDFESAVNYCPCLGAVFPAETKEGIDFHKVAFKRSLPEEMVEKYPYLVSLSIPMYFDNPDLMLLACNGIITTSDTLLTFKTCVYEEIEWYNITIRSRSAYWSKGGDTHKVVKVLPTNSEFVVELKIWPEFNETIVPNSRPVFPFEGNWTYAVKIGWESHYTAQIRYKYNKFDIEEWTTVDYSGVSTDICYDYERCRPISKILVTSCQQLVAVEADGRGCGKFLGLTSSRKLKDCKIIHLSDDAITEREVCHL